MFDIIIPAITGLFAGLVASLIAPWVHWGIEKRRDLNIERKMLMKLARRSLSFRFQKSKFREDDIYFRLKPLLSKELTDSIESDTIASDKGADDYEYIKSVHVELIKIEKKWKLI